MVIRMNQVQKCPSMGHLDPLWITINDLTIAIYTADSDRRHDAKKTNIREPLERNYRNRSSLSIRSLDTSLTRFSRAILILELSNSVWTRATSSFGLNGFAR